VPEERCCQARAARQGEWRGSYLQSEHRTLRVLCVPRKYESPEDDAAREGHRLQIPKRVVLVRRRGDPRPANQGRAQPGDDRRPEHVGPCERAHDPSLIYPSVNAMPIRRSSRTPICRDAALSIPGPANYRRAEASWNRASALPVELLGMTAWVSDWNGGRRRGRNWTGPMRGEAMTISLTAAKKPIA
jgi:hypothetical protein